MELFPEEKEENVSCIPPAVTQFPSPGFNKKSRQHGAVIIYILVAVYMFIGLAIVCDDYFVPALTRVSDGEIKLLYAFYTNYPILYSDHYVRWL